eukprot:TRINITY_DN1951_c0_g1_i1.p1 TRINITY_DN1951_c0_g1~~TRINITY_DN1951_c0_g1_i1.p1  ORF type:complete len:693 (+),score=216.71 TRINITY_DN1951_c0_g1_i1:175-2253(+)
MEPAIVSQFDNNFEFGADKWKGAGVAVPVFSLRTKQSMGVGEFYDIKKLVDWSRKAGMSLVQTLPINDTSCYQTWRDTYPYKPVSIMALHPMYMHLPALAKGDEELLKQMAIETERLNAVNLNKGTTQVIEYEDMMKVKLGFLKQIYTRDQVSLATDAEYQAYLKANVEWLKPYGVFCVLRDLFKTAAYAKWPAYYQTMTPAVLEEIAGDDSFIKPAVEFWYFVQFHLHKQMIEASEYAQENHVVLKGDLPIGVGRWSVDTWMEPHYFNMDRSTGAPPDAFSAIGQNWGFPTYNWDAMAQDDFAWWKRRLSRMSEYFKAFRIDHILGFFRIWSVPHSSGVWGMVGEFDPVHQLWRDDLQKIGVWDFDRLTKPYIRQHLLEESFGKEWSEIAAIYMNDDGNCCYSFKPEFDTEKKLKRHIRYGKATGAKKLELETLHQKLSAFMGNVILIPASEYGYHCRVEFPKTSSFAELSPELKGPLERIHHEYFFVNQEDLWREQSYMKLPMMIQSNDMLVCGEDLGMVPNCVKAVMDNLQIMSLRVQRMPADPAIKVAHPADYEYMSVCTTGSHDTTTLRGWWSEEEKDTLNWFWYHIMGRTDALPEKLDSGICYDIINQHMYSPSMWTILPLQDFLAIDDELMFPDADDERINVPANPIHYWRYRCHLDMDDLLAADDFNAKLKNLVGESRIRAYHN